MTTLVLNHPYMALDRKKDCAAIFFGLTKDFDTVDHRLLPQGSILGPVLFDIYNSSAHLRPYRMHNLKPKINLVECIFGMHEINIEKSIDLGCGHYVCKPCFVNMAEKYLQNQKSIRDFRVPPDSCLQGPNQNKPAPQLHTCCRAETITMSQLGLR